MAADSSAKDLKTKEVTTTTTTTKPKKKGSAKYDQPEKHPGGRPRLFKTPQQLGKLIAAYFRMCEEKDKPLTYAGLALALGMDRQTLYNYQERDEFFDTIKKARDTVKAYVEEQMFIRGSAGVIFYAKNYGYTDRQEVDVNGVDFGGALEKFVGKLGGDNE